MTALASLRLYAPLIREMVRRELRGRYAGSALGLFWSVIHPLLQLVIYTLVFGKLLKVPLGGRTTTSSFALYLFCGLLPWNAFAETLNRSASSLIENASLIKNLRFPAKIIQIAVALNALLHQLLGLFILLILTGWLQHGFFSASLLIVPLMLLQFLFMLGVGLVAAPLTVSFRDFLQLLPVINMVWFYLTPVFYPASIVPESMRFMLWLNPMHYFVGMSRDLLLDGTVPSLSRWAAITVMSGTIFLFGYTYYTRRHAGFADEL